MGTLLKDMPIHMERIENNYSLMDEIKYKIEYGLEFDHKGSNYSDISVNNAKEISENLLGIFTDFVNQNYEWKGLKA